MANAASGTITTNATTTALDWDGGPGVFIVQGTFDSATIKLQYSIDGGTTKTDAGTDTTLTASGGGSFLLPGGVKLYVNSASGGGSLSTTYLIRATPYPAGL